MPLTSLAAQLKKLEAPQTSLLYHKKTRPSLLFDAKEAAEYDRDTFYDLGVSGLKELKKLNTRFSEFEETLFDVTSKSFERAVETSETNERLDAQIRDFLALLSPYFLLRPAHKALEWLINRYHVEQYNVAELLSLALPYHETSTFGRLLGLLAIGDNDPAWLWLVPVRRASAPLSKTALLNRAATDMAFFRFVAGMPDRAIKVHGDGASSLSTLFSFYCTTLLGALEYSSRVTELHVSHLLPSVMSALTARDLPDYTASAYIVLARLVTRIRLSEKLMHGLYNKISKVEHVKLRSESALMLVLMAQNDVTGAVLPERAVRRLATNDGGRFTAIVVQLAENSPGLVIVPLIRGLLRTSLRTVQQGGCVDGIEDLKRFVHDLLLGDLRFDDEDSDQIFWCLLEEFEEDVDKPTAGWYERLVRSLEVRYPKGFDRVATAALSDGDIPGGGGAAVVGRRRAVRRLLGGGGGATRDQLFQRLVHPDPLVRAQAVKHVGKHMRPEQVSWLQEWLWERLEDDRWEVVREAVRLPDELLVAMSRQNRSDLTDRLARTVARSWAARWHPCPSASDRCLRPAVAALLRSAGPLDDPLLVLVLTPLLVDSTLRKTHALVLESEISDRVEFFRAIKELKAKTGGSVTDGNLCPTIWEVMEGGRGVPLGESTAAALARLTDCATEGHRFVAALLSTAAVPRSLDPKETAAIVARVIEYVKSPNIKGDERSPRLSGSTLERCVTEAMEHRVLPVEAVLHTLEVVASRGTPPPSNNDDGCSPARWVSFNNERDVLVLATLKLIIEGLSALDPAVTMAFIQVKYAYLKNYFPSRESLISFLVSALVLKPDVGPEYLVTLRSTLGRDGGGASAKENNHLLLGRNSVLVPGLLLLMASEDSGTRTLALDCMAAIVSDSEGTFYGPLVGEVIKYREEIKMDSNQVAVVLYTRLLPSSDVQSVFLSGDRIGAMRAILDRLICAVLDRTTTPLPIRASLLRLLESVNSPEIYLRLLPIVDELIGRSAVLDEPESAMLAGVLRRLDATTVVCFSELHYWDHVAAVLADHSTRVRPPAGGGGDEKPTSPAVLLLNQISREAFERLPNGDLDRERLLELAVGSTVDGESIEVGSATAALFKRIAVDCTVLVRLFRPMLAASDNRVTSPPARGKLRKRLSSAPPLELLETSEWKRGVCLLELIQGKKKLSNIHCLLPTLFEILKKCLAFEQQAPVEYTKQLVLSAVLDCCQHGRDSGNVGGGSVTNIGDCVQVDLIVQCVRASQNPQTHHHALLALTHLAHIVPDQVLHNIMAIFTFIGSSVLRQEDAYSFQIISKIVDTVVPVLIQSESRELVGRVAGVLRVFVSAMLDIPEHRRLPLLKRLMQTLNDGEYLWVFLCLVFDAHVKPHNLEEFKVGKGITSVPRRLDVALQLCVEFQPDVVLNTCQKLLAHLAFMPDDKDENFKKEKFKDVREIFNIDENSVRQLRHYKFTLITFLSLIVSAPHFVQQIAVLPDAEVSCLEPTFRIVIEECLRYVRTAARKSETSSQTSNAKYWKAMLNQSYDVLEKTTALLPTEIFLSIVGGLLGSTEDPALKRKAMELLGWKLQQADIRFPPDSLSALLGPIVEAAERQSAGARVGAGQEHQLCQQTALFALKLMTRHLAPDNVETFKQILGKVSDLLVERSKVRQEAGGCGSASWGVLGSLVLCLGELVSALKAHSIARLAKFMPALIKIVDAHLETNESNFLFVLSLVTGIGKVVDCLARFLSPYLGQLLYQLNELTARVRSDPERHHNHQAAVNKLKAIRTRLSSDVECRVLVPAVSWAFDRTVGRRPVVAPPDPLLSVLSASFTSASDLTPELVTFFTRALDFRSSASDAPSPADVDVVETAVVDCLTSVVLKLSESAFRPLYYRLYDWAARSETASVGRAITFYRLSSRIAESLKGLFVLFAGHFVGHAARLLDENNTKAAPENDAGEPMESESASGEEATQDRLSCLLVDNILRTLLTVFMYDSQRFVNGERFDALMQPLVDQLENRIGGLEVSVERCDKLVTPCLAQMAACSGDDTHWKQLNYQILLKTRHQSSHVRIAALDAVCAVAKKLGEDFLPLLPETVPFLAELLEDDEEAVERKCQRVIADMETILGEPIQKYF